MAIEIDSIKKFIPEESITNKSVTRSKAKDVNSAFSYVEWLQRVLFETRDSLDYTKQYNEYLKSWAKETNLVEAKALTLISNRYKDLLRDITLNYTTEEEKRFLANVNYSNIRHVEAALPFYTSKIKQISLYVSKQRDLIKQQKTIASYSGCIQGVINDISSSVLNRVLDPTKFNTSKTESESEPYFNVSIVELYDFSKDYFQQNNIPVIDLPFKDATDILQEVLTECQPVLKLSDNINIVLASQTQILNPANEIQTLDYSEFFNYTKDPDNLNILKRDDYMLNRLGVDLYSLKDGEVSLLASPQKPWRNLLNRHTVSVNDRHSRIDQKTRDEIGGFFIPQNTGLLTFYSYKPQYIITDTSANINVLQDINRHGNSVWSDTIGNPVDHYENVTWLKADIANGSAYGDIVGSKRHAKFSGYTSVDEVQNTPQQGVSRSTDALGFFNGEKNKTWANEDVFPVENQFVFDIDGRQKTLITGHRSVYRWRTDIFGNEYALYKKIQPERGPFDVGLDDIIEYEQAPNCEVIDCGESLRTDPHMYEENVEVQLFEGGRIAGSDPKVEQYEIPVPFPDLRRIADVTESGEPIYEEWNTAYHGLSPVADRETMDFTTPIMYHGFAPDIAYDRQAYCGLFTDDVCGRIVPERDRCAITDNYAFNVYTEFVTDEEYVSAEFWASSADAFDEYLNPIPTEYDFDHEHGFTQFGVPASAADLVELKDGPNIDGAEFTNEICSNLQGDFYHAEINETYFDTTLEVGETKYEDEPKKSMTEPETLYAQKTTVGGEGWFRSYNGSKISTFKDALKKVLGGFDLMEGEEHGKFKSALNNSEIIDIDILYDVIVIETKDHLYIDKINFDADKCELLPTGTSNIFLRTTGEDPECERSLGWFFNEETNELIFGKTVKVKNPQPSTTRDYVVDTITGNQAYVFAGNDQWNPTLEVMAGDVLNFRRTSVGHLISIQDDAGNVIVQANSEMTFVPEKPGIYYYVCDAHPDMMRGEIIVDSEDYVYPVVYGADLNTLKYNQVHPNKHYKNQLADNFKLPEDLTGFYITRVDRPVLTYNTVTNVYNVSFSCNLKKGKTSKYAISSSDYRKRKYNWKLLDNYLYHSSTVTEYVSPGEVWDEQIVDKEIKLRPDASMRPIPGTKNHTSRTESLSAMTGYPLSGYTFDLTIDTKTIPVGLALEDYKINRIIFDPGDGTTPYVNVRTIDDGLQPLTFDLTDLPDPSDFGDPRRLGFSHTYVFDKSEPHVYTAKIIAQFSNFNTATYNIDIETMPYSVDSGLGGAKLIDSKLYTDVEGKDRQLLVIETQSPRYVTNVIVDRFNGVSNIISGYVDGSRYTGPYHTDSNGHPMTGETHTEDSRYILRIPVIGNAPPEPAPIPRRQTIDPGTISSNLVLPAASTRSTTGVTTTPVNTTSTTTGSTAPTTSNTSDTSTSSSYSY